MNATPTNTIPAAFAIAPAPTTINSTPASRIATGTP